MPHRPDFEPLVVATTCAHFASFAPYAPALSDDGLVAFHRALRDGRTGIFLADGESVEAIALSNGREIIEYASHADLRGGGDLCAHVRCADGASRLVLPRHGAVDPIADGAGPLGPTMNRAGAVAFRATTTDGRQRVLVVRDGVVRALAETGPRFVAFHGLPVVDSSGAWCSP